MRITQFATQEATILILSVKKSSVTIVSFDFLIMKEVKYSLPLTLATRIQVLILPLWKQCHL